MKSSTKWVWKWIIRGWTCMKVPKHHIEQVQLYFRVILWTWEEITSGLKMYLWLLWGFGLTPPPLVFPFFFVPCISLVLPIILFVFPFHLPPSFTCHVPPSLTFPSLLSFSGGIYSDLQDKRKKCQNKRKNQITDSSQLKDFPCKKFRQVSSPTHRKSHKRDPVSCEHTRRK